MPVAEESKDQENVKKQPQTGCVEVDEEAATKALAAALKNLTFKNRMILLWGKVRRWWLLTFCKSYVKKQLELRRGDCTRVGCCCHLGYSCPWLRSKDVEGCKSECKHYSIRPKNCRVFPIDDRDFKDRDILLPDHPCGYYFEKEPKSDD